MKFLNTKTGIMLESRSSITGPDWEAVKEPEAQTATRPVPAVKAETTGKKPEKKPAAKRGSVKGSK